MRTNLNTQAKSELIAIAEALGFSSLNHTLSVLITRSYKEIVNAKTQELGVNGSNASSTNKQ